jgi:hypothetical protein
VAGRRAVLVTHHNPETNYGLRINLNIEPAN